MNITILSLAASSIYSPSPVFVGKHFSLTHCYFQKAFPLFFYDQVTLHVKDSSFYKGLGGVLLISEPVVNDVHWTYSETFSNGINIDVNFEKDKSISVSFIGCSFISIKQDVIAITKKELSLYITRSTFANCESTNGVAYLAQCRCVTITHTCSLNSKGSSNCAFLNMDCNSEDFFMCLYSSIITENNYDPAANEPKNFYCQNGVQYIRCINMTNFPKGWAFQFDNSQCFSFGMSNIIDCKCRVLELSGKNSNNQSYVIEKVNIKTSYYSKLIKLHSNVGFSLTFYDSILINENNGLFDKDNGNNVHMILSNCVYYGKNDDLGPIETKDGSKFGSIDEKLIEFQLFINDSYCPGVRYLNDDEIVKGCNAEDCVSKHGSCNKTIGFPDGVVSYQTLIDTKMQTALFTPSKPFSPSKQFSPSRSFSPSAKFSPSHSFSSSEKFSPSGKFSPTLSFSKSGSFTSSKPFSNSVSFSSSNEFSDSKKFSNSHTFTQSHGFTQSSKFSGSNAFSLSSDFTKSGYFTKTSHFSSSFYFTNTDAFSRTGAFSETTDFTKSDLFTKSSDFSPSHKFTPSHGFNASHTFTPSIPFNASNCFSESSFFSLSNQFSDSSFFSGSADFSSTRKFSETQNFTLSEHFTDSNLFTFSIQFSSSLGFTPSNDFNATHTFTPSSLFSASSPFNASCHFTSSSQFSESAVFTHSNNFTGSLHFSSSTPFTKSSEFTDSKSFTPSNHFDATHTFTASNNFTASNYFTASSEFTKSAVFTNSKEFTSSNHFTSSDVFTSSVEFTPSKTIRNNVVINVNEGSKNRKTAVIAGTVAATVCAVGLVAAIIAFFIVRHRRHEPSSDMFEELNPIEDTTSSITYNNVLHGLDIGDDPFEDDFHMDDHLH